MPESPGDHDLVRRALLEEPQVRAARRAHQRWVSVQRLWAAMDRLGIIEEEARIRFVCRAMWPVMPREQVDDVVARATASDAEPTWRLRRPMEPADVVGSDAAALIRVYSGSSQRGP